MIGEKFSAVNGTTDEAWNQKDIFLTSPKHDNKDFISHIALGDPFSQDKSRPFWVPLEKVRCREEAN